MPKTYLKSIPKFQRSRYLVLFCPGPKPGNKCGYAIDINTYSHPWTKCPLCGGKLIRAWHNTGRRYAVDEQPEPYTTNNHRITRTI
ncbi:hypothetical protein ES703_53465 [subsurface metagenome]